MGKFDRRLARLEIVWPERAQTNETDIGHLDFWSHPIYPGEFRQFLIGRAQERYIATVRDGRYGSNTITDPGWIDIDREEKATRITFEYDELIRLTELLGDGEGWEAWHDQARNWPQKYGRFDAASLERRLMHAWTVADTHRAHPDRPLWRSVWPEWKPGMSFDEHVIFDQIVERERERRCQCISD